MELDYENDPGLELLGQILLQKEFLRTGVEDDSEEFLEKMEIKFSNVVEIILGKDDTVMDYRTHQEEELEKPDRERQKVVFATTSQYYIKEIDLMKDYFSTGDLKPLQDYLDELMEQ